MIQCLMVDDDAAIRALVAGYLAQHGLNTEAVADGAALRQRLPRGGIDIVLLDLMLPDEDGLSLCRWIRQTAPQLPVIMLTAQGDPLSRVLGLELGADDYLAKPFEPRELVARIRAVLRRGGTGHSDAGTPVRFRGWAFDRLRRHLRAPDNSLVSLSGAEFRLLGAFVAHPGRVLSRERLLELTRASGAEVNDRSIDLAVSRLRSKLADGDDATGTPPLIRTLRGEGYRFDAEVS